MKTFARHILILAALGCLLAPAVPAKSKAPSAGDSVKTQTSAKSQSRAKSQTQSKEQTPATAQTPAQPQPFTPDTLRARYDRFSLWCSPEKVYLHMDRTCYAAGESIWFKAYVKNASQRAQLPESNFVYVELLNSKGEKEVRVKIKRLKDGFHGNIEVPDLIASGDYTVRAYTLWQTNFSPEYMFNQKVRIIGEDVKKKVPQASKDTDISFYPESGRYFAGMLSCVGFKAMNSLGQSLDLSANLIDDTGTVISETATIHDGMGRLTFIPQPERTYYLQIPSGKRFKLPEPSLDGAAINIRRHADELMVSLIGKGTYSLCLRDLYEVKPLVNTTLDGNIRAYKMNLKEFRSGINHFLLVDHNGKIVAERLFFVPEPKSVGINCALFQNTQTAEAKSLVQAGICLSDQSGHPLKGNCSVSVVRGKFSKYVQDDGIVSYMGLSSELRGHINEPGYYFDEEVPEKDRLSNLDLLLMIQGWRFYNLPAMTGLDGIFFKLKEFKEYVQSVKGHIERLISGKVPKNFIFTVMIPKQKFTNFKDVDAAKYFTVDSLNLPENTGIFIKADKINSSSAYFPRWDGETFAPEYRYVPAPGKAKKASAESDDAAQLMNKNEVLNAAVVTASATDDPFEGATAGRRVSNMDLLTFKDMSLIDYLRMKAPQFIYDGENMTNKNRSRGGSVNTTENEDGTVTVDGVEGGSGGVVKLIVDDFEQPWWLFETVTLDELAAISVSTSPDFFRGAAGGSVTLKVKSGVTVSSKADRKPALLFFIPLGYQTPQYFYSPRYDRGDKSDNPDNRTTIFWDPSVNLEAGYADIQFCNPDYVDAPYSVRIEGTTNDGRPFSCHTTINFN